MPLMLRSIALRLMSSYLVIIVTISALFSYVGIRVIDGRIVGEAQRRVAESLSAGREIYGDELRAVQQSVRVTGERFFLRDALAGALPAGRVASMLEDVMRRERLDFLAVADARGRVRWRPSHPEATGDDLGADPLVRAALERAQAVAATAALSDAVLRRERPALADSARTPVIATAHARARPDTVETVGLALTAAAPVEDAGGRVIGVVYGGVLLNRRHGLVDRVKRVVFEDAEYRGRPVGAASVFLEDLRVATNVPFPDGTRALGTRADSEVYEQVVRRGRRWVSPTFVMDEPYIAAYEPIRDFAGRTVGMLGVGTLEGPYLDLRRSTTLLFLGITLGGAALTIGLSYVMSQRLSRPARQLVAASRRLAHGELDTTVAVPTVAEFAELAESYNAMAAALRSRDEKLHDFARRKIMESERLALIGQLAADVAHELNNPLQGIVTYSHLLRERGASSDAAKGWVEKIVIQADRSTRIIRGLLDFSRPRTPIKRPTHVNALLDECIALVEHQALFQNIEVVKQYAGDVPAVVIDRSLMQQVFMNLIINAVEAMKGGGRLALTTCFDPIAHMVEVGVLDTGHGIKPEDVDRVFEPFFTTKEVGHGTGLGLAISFGIVKEHHGAIAVESELGKGTAFTISLPVNGTGEA
jgi:two-component system NtrC family sensor kinase